MKYLFSLIICLFIYCSAQCSGKEIKPTIYFTTDEVAFLNKFVDSFDEYCKQLTGKDDIRSAYFGMFDCFWDKRYPGEALQTLEIEKFREKWPFKRIYNNDIFDKIWGVYTWNRPDRDDPNSFERVRELKLGSRSDYLLYLFNELSKDYPRIKFYVEDINMTGGMAGIGILVFRKEIYYQILDITDRRVRMFYAIHFYTFASTYDLVDIVDW